MNARYRGMTAAHDIVRTTNESEQSSVTLTVRHIVIMRELLIFASY